MLSDMDLYETEDAKVDTASKETEPEEKKVVESEYIFDKTYRCPVCDSEFKTKAMKTGKAKLLNVDSDLRPKYQDVDSLKYDCVVCAKCGYAALGRYFNYVSGPQVKLIREKITPFFKGIDDKAECYTYEEAITRHQLALANAVIKKGKASEKAYICLKIAWLFRGKRENLPEDEENRDNVIKELRECEKQYIQKAYEGFAGAIYKENFPIAGMDEWTCMYLTADLAFQCEDYTRTMKLVSDIIVSKGASAKLKDRARILRKEAQNK